MATKHVAMTGQHRFTKNVVVAALLCLVPFSYPASGYADESTAQAKPAASYFPLKKGYCWKYHMELNDIDKRTSEVTVTDIEEIARPDGTKAHGLKTEMSGFPNHTSTNWYLETEDGIETNASPFPADWNENKSHIKYLKLPLSSGLSWEGEWSHGLRGAPYPSPPITVSGPTSVTVPAGTFQAFRVHKESQSGCCPSANDCWYAPGVGLIKTQYSLQSNALLELVEYQFPEENKSDGKANTEKPGM